MKKATVYRIISFAAAVIMLCASFSACKKDKGNKLTDEQQTALINAAEAFYEYGGSYNSENMIPMDEAEMFVYYYYNDKLEAAEGDYALLSKDEAEKFFKTFFGYSIFPHPHAAENDGLLLYAEGNYLIKVRPAAADCEVKQITMLEDGKFEGSVSCRGENGQVSNLMLVFKIVDDSIRILECDHFDFA